MRRLCSFLFVSWLALGPAALAVVPVPPDQIAYSGVLDSPGPVDLTARLYDAGSGGTLIFMQSFTGVALDDGHFTVNLGPTGAASDSPTNPLTTNLREALTGDLGAGAGRFVEITVNAEPPLARVQLMLVPYALRADQAATADVALRALDTQAVDGVDGSVVGQLFEAWNFDGGPPSSDPREGTGDVDGDGQANFVDADNDNDGISDTNEVNGGTNINLVTPTIGSVSPTSGTDSQPTLVTITGTGFLPGLTAKFGAQTFNPDTSPTSFQVTLAPQPAGAVPDLLVTNPNGESALRARAFQFVGTPPPVPPIGTGGCGIGPELALLMPLLAWLRRAGRASYAVHTGTPRACTTGGQ